MKKHNHFLKKITAGLLGFVMTLGVGAAGYAASASETRAATTYPSAVTQVTDLSQIANGDKILIGTNDGAKYCNEATSSGHFQTTAFGTTAPSANNVDGVFTLEQDGTTANKYYLHGKKGYLYETKSSSGGGATTTDKTKAKAWLFVAGDNTNQFDMKYDGNTAYLRSYNNATFRTYSSKNGNSITLFKYASKSLSSIAVTTSTHRTFTQGDSFVKETITATYSDNSTADVTSSAVFTNNSTSSIGTRTVNVSYTEGGVNKTTSYSITVNARTLSSITVSSNHRSFVQGSTFVGETITAHYNNGATATVSGSYSSVNMNTLGKQTVTASYTEGEITKKVDYEIEITEPITLSSIAVTSDTHRTFKIDSEFAKETITATYSDNSTKNVTNSAIFTGQNMSAAGTYTISVSYTEDGVSKETSYQITVKDYSILPSGVTYSIVLDPNSTGSNFKKDYEVGTDTSTDWYNDNLNVSGTATYSAASGSYPNEYKFAKNLKQYLTFKVSGNSQAIISKVVFQLTNSHPENLTIDNGASSGAVTYSPTAYTPSGSSDEFSGKQNVYYVEPSGDQVKFLNGSGYDTFFLLARVDIVVPASYDVTNNLTDCTSNGAAKASTASDYTATLSPGSGYDGIKVDSVTINGAAGAYSFISNVLTIQKANITGSIVITAHGTKSQYTVTASGTGVTFPTEIPKAEYKTAYNLSFSIKEGYETPVSFSVKRGTTTVTGATLANNTISVPAADVTAALTISVTATAKTYTLDKSGLNNLSFTPSGTSSLSHGGTFSGTLDVTTEGYTLDGATISVTMGGVTVPNAYDSENHTITVANVSGDIVISGSAEEIKTSIIELDKTSFRIQENNSDYIQVTATLAELLTSSATFVSGVDVADFIALDTNTDKVQIVGKDGARGTGNYTLTVSYNNESGDSTTKDFTGITVEVYGDDLVSISLSSTSGTSYLGEDFTKPTVTATYSVSGDQTVEANWSDFDKYTIGSQTLTAEYGGETATYIATVEAKTYTKDVPVEKTLTITAGDLGGTNQSYELKNWTVDGVSGGAYSYLNTGKFQFNGGKGTNMCFNTSSLPGKIKSITVTRNSEGSNRNVTAYVHTSEMDTSNYQSGTSLGQKTVTTSGVTWSVPDTNLNENVYFYLDYQTSNALYVDNIQVVYEKIEQQTSTEKHPIRITDATCTAESLLIGSTLSKNDFKIKVQYDTADTIFDNITPKSIKKKTGEGTYSDDCTLTAGDNTFKITYSETYNNIDYSVTYEKVVTADAKIIDYISVPAGQTIKKTYIAGETFDPSGLTINVTYKNRLYADEVIKYDDCPSNFTFTYKYDGASASDPEIPASQPFEVQSGEKIDAKIKILYNDGTSSDDVNTLTVHVAKTATPVTNLSIKNLTHKLDVYDHKTYQLEADVSPADATDNTVRWESLDESVATVTEDGLLTVVATDTSKSLKVRCTTNGLDGNGQPLVREKTIALYKHSSFEFVIGDENGNPIAVDENFKYELGKTYTITATDVNFPDEDEHISWTIASGSNSITLSKSTGKQAKFYVKKAADTKIQLYASVHDSGNKGTPSYSSTYQPVSNVVISTDKTKLYTNEEATISLSTNTYSQAQSITWKISDESIASVTKVDNVDNTYKVSFAKQGNVTIYAIVDGVDSNPLTFNAVSDLNPIMYTTSVDVDGTATWTKQQSINKYNATESGDAVPDDDIDSHIHMTGDKGTATASIRYWSDGLRVYAGNEITLTPLNGATITSFKIGTSGTCPSGVTYNSSSGYYTVTSGGNSAITITGLSKATVGSDIIVNYTYKNQGSVDIANKNIVAQEKVVDFANYLNGLASISPDNWIGEDSVKSNFDATVGTLTGDNLTYAMNMLKNATASNAADSDCLQQAMKRYDDFVKNYNLLDSTNNFLGRTLTATPHTVTFLNQDGTTLGTDTNVVYGEKPSYAGSTPTKESTTTENYSFVGWSTNKNAQAGDADVYTSANLPELNNVEGETYYAIYSSSTRTYSLAFDNNGGGTVPSAVTGIEYNNPVDLTKYTATNREGYEFAGWSTTADGKNMVTSITLTADNTKVYAVWNKLYKAQYLTTDSTSGSAPTDPTWYKVDALVEVQGAGTLAKDGYRFGGWELNGTVYAPGKKFIMPEGGAELTPVWNKLYTASYNVGDIEVGKYVSGETFTLPEGPTKDGYTFIGWSDGTAVFTAEYTMGSKDVTFVAKYHNDDIDYIEVTGVSGDAFFYYEQGDEGVTSVTNLKIRFGCEFDEEVIELYGDASVYDYGMVIVKTADLNGEELTELFANAGFNFEEFKADYASAKQGTWDKMASNNSSGNPDFGCTLSYKDLTNATQMNTEWSVIFYVVDDSGNYVITDAGQYSMRGICENKVNDNSTNENLKEVFQYILDQFQK